MFFISEYCDKCEKCFKHRKDSSKLLQKIFLSSSSPVFLRVFNMVLFLITRNNRSTVKTVFRFFFTYSTDMQQFQIKGTRIEGTSWPLYLFCWSSLNWINEFAAGCLKLLYIDGWQFSLEQWVLGRVSLFSF
jgi:hypothetical protein